MKISMDKKYKTVDGQPVQLISVSGRSQFPVVGYIGGSTIPLCWQMDGRYYSGVVKNDLIEISPYGDFKKDDPVMVRDFDGEEWQKKHFAYEKDGRAYCHQDGCTSWSDSAMTQVWWEQCRKPTKEELNNA